VQPLRKDCSPSLAVAQDCSPSLAVAQDCSPSLAVAQDGHLQRVTIPEAAYVQLRR